MPGVEYGMHHCPQIITISILIGLYRSTAPSSEYCRQHSNTSYASKFVCVQCCISHTLRPYTHAVTEGCGSRLMLKGVACKSMAHERGYWEGRWIKADYSWQRTEVDARLQKYLPRLTCDTPIVSIFVPLCGKTLDVPWLCQQGHSVVGVEFSDIAARELFEEHNIPHSVTEQDSFKVYAASDRNLKVFVGDYFEFEFEQFSGSFDATWDCNAFGAIAIDNRLRYIEKLNTLLKPKGRILMSAYEFDQSLRDRHPFSIHLSLMVEQFGAKYDVELVETLDYTGTDFTQKFGLTWANKLYYFLTRK